MVDMATLTAGGTVFALNRYLLKNPVEVSVGFGVATMVLVTVFS